MVFKAALNRRTHGRGMPLVKLATRPLTICNQLLNEERLVHKRLARKGTSAFTLTSTPP